MMTIEMGHFSYEEMLRELGLFGLEKASEQTNCGLPMSEGSLQKRWRETVFKSI